MERKIAGEMKIINKMEKEMGLNKLEILYLENIFRNITKTKTNFTTKSKISYKIFCKNLKTIKMTKSLQI